MLFCRRSIRRYENKEIPKDILGKIVEAGRQPSSAANKQPYPFVIVTDSELKKHLKGLLNLRLYLLYDFYMLFYGASTGLLKRGQNTWK
jgi:nitroreductase